jgi:hypothetical protein
MIMIMESGTIGLRLVRVFVSCTLMIGSCTYVQWQLGGELSDDWQ